MHSQLYSCDTSITFPLPNILHVTNFIGVVAWQKTELLSRLWRYSMGVVVVRLATLDS